MACSPHRVAAFVAYLTDDWAPEALGQALAVLPAWVAYCLERSGITGEAADAALALAQSAVADPQAVAGEHARTMDLPYDETTLVTRAG